MDTNVMAVAEQLQAVKDGYEALVALLKMCGTGLSVIAVAVVAWLVKNKSKFLNSHVLDELAKDRDELAGGEKKP